MRFRRSLAVLVAALMLALSAPASVPVLATGGNCEKLLEYTDWVWSETSSPSYARTAVQAFIDPDHLDFQPCTASGLDIYGHSWGWVSIQPRLFLNSNALIQVGIEYRTGQSAPRFFYALEGCTGSIQAAYFPGSADWARRAYVIWRWWGNPGWYWRLQVNNATNTGVQHYVDISESDPRISCWITGNRKATWTGERHDTGDSLGTYPNPALKYDTMAFKATNSSAWQFPGTGFPCFLSSTEGQGIGDQLCGTGTNTLSIWSLN